MNFKLYLIRSIVVLQTTLLPIQIALAQNVTNKWQALEVPVWQGERADNGGYYLPEGWGSFNLPLKQVEGQWVRLSVATDVNAPDFNVWIHAFDAKSNQLTKSLPTRCEITSEHKVCSNLNWIKPGGATARVVFYYPDMLPITIAPGNVEVALAPILLPENIARYKLLSKDIERLYYRKKEVNWELAKSTGEQLLIAPSDIDPLPFAILRLIAALPGNSHSYIFSNGNIQQTAHPIPKCVRLSETTWRLDLPATSSKEADYPKYVAQTHRCLARKGVSRWLVNLTENSGGNSATMFAALAPLLGTGSQMMFHNPEGEKFVVGLTNHTVVMNGEIEQRWHGAIQRFKGEVAFAIGAGCGSSCEAIAIAAKGRFTLLGQTTAGYATANQTIPVNTTYSLALTTGFMADMKGKVYSSVEPDIVLDEAATKQLLIDGKYLYATNERHHHQTQEH